MEIGSFIELGFQQDNEFHKGNLNIARLNTGRAAIYHAMRLLNCRIVYLPVYQCETVRNFLIRKNVKIKYYRMDWEFNPIMDCIEEDACIVVVSYFGIMGVSRMEQLTSRFERIIVDNAQSFYSKPIQNVYSVYSARKFVGVPDGAYVIGKGAEKYTDEYGQCYSSDTSLFLLQRVEYGCEGKTYTNRSVNEERIDQEDILKMSKLTRGILDGYNYNDIQDKRRANFRIAAALFDDVNLLDVHHYYDNSCVPMVYPLVIEDDDLLPKLLKAKHFQGRWWNYLRSEVDEGYFEYWLSRYMIPVTIDQRYGKEELEYIRSFV